MNARASLIITTYNRPDALNLVLRSITRQSLLPSEVIVADDGSGAATQDLITRWKSEFPCPLLHVRQEDDGFRAARIRNRASAAARGDYLIFLDGDCVLRNTFVANHVNLARPGRFVAGNRVLLSKDFTREVLSSNTDIEDWPISRFQPDQINRRWALGNVPLGLLRRARSRNWKQLKSCNFSLWKNDYIAVNGMDEAFVGWGYEDSELAIRLLRHGLRGTSGRLATTVLHLWHQEQDRDRESENHEMLLQVAENTKKRATRGIDQYLRNGLTGLRDNPDGRWGNSDT